MDTLWLLLCAVTFLASVRGDAELEGNTFTFSGAEPEEAVTLVEVGEEDRFDYNIRGDDGSYQYGYQSGRLGEDGGYSFKHEYKGSDGILYGQHGYELPDGYNMTVSYVADARGFRVLSDGDAYTPVSEEELQRQRSLLGEAASYSGDGDYSWDEEEPLSLDLGHLQLIENPETVEFESDPAVLLESVPLEPINDFSPESGAFRFRYRTVDHSGAVTFRMEERRPDGVVIGQYGHRASGEPGSVVTYVSDAFGYRLVDPSIPVPVVSRERALAELPEEALVMRDQGPAPIYQMAAMEQAGVGVPEVANPEVAAMAMPEGGMSIEPAMEALEAEMEGMEPVMEAMEPMLESAEAGDSSMPGEVSSATGAGGADSVQQVSLSTGGAIVVGRPEDIGGASSAEASAAVAETAEAVLSLTGGDTLWYSSGQQRPSLLQMMQPQTSNIGTSAPITAQYTTYQPYYQPYIPYHGAQSYTYVYQPDKYSHQQYQRQPYGVWYPYLVYPGKYLAQIDSAHEQYAPSVYPLNVLTNSENDEKQEIRGFIEATI